MAPDKVVTVTRNPFGFEIPLLPRPFQKLKEVLEIELQFICFRCDPSIMLVYQRCPQAKWKCCWINHLCVAVYGSHTSYWGFGEMHSITFQIISVLMFNLRYDKISKFLQVGNTGNVTISCYEKQGRICRVPETDSGCLMKKGKVT